MRRRTFLGAMGLGALGVATTRAVLASPASAAVSQPRTPQIFRSPAAARRIAEAWLRRHPEQAPRRALAAGLGCDAEAGWDTLCDALGPARRADFRAGRTLVVDGWLVAESEARLCALAVLHGGARC